ncbi:MAG: hypothetical protein H7338_18900 [Candidatus Sericytochromatia bacterium]|nr:hypothetical protein [Candidatus Sericytochromatia bacterium]
MMGSDNADMSNALVAPLQPPTPDVTAVAREAARAVIGGPGPTPTPGVAADAAPVTGPTRGIPATTPVIHALTTVPAAGTILKFNGGVGPDGLGDVINHLFRTPSGFRDDPVGSNWGNANDIRLVLPVMQARSGAIGTSIVTLPGREMTWATIAVGRSNADSKFNLDGVQGAVRLGVAGAFVGPITPSHGSQPMASSPMALQWAEVRVGAEGLVFTGRVTDGAVSITGFDLENGYFKAQLDGLGDWAGNHLAVAIPVGLAAAGASAFAISALAQKTGKDIALPLGLTVYDNHGISIRPLVRPIFGKTDFVKFGGAELSLGYTLPGKVQVNLLPGYNNDPTLGPKGVTVGSRVAVPLPFGGVAGAEVRYNPQGGVSAFVGASFSF